jgi:putative SOS response-associated peptidase YedK
MERMYKDAALYRPCLIPMNRFYEWRHVHVVGNSGKLLKTPEKFPYNTNEYVSKK